MLPTTTFQTAPGTSHLVQGVSTRFATVTKTATSTATTTATNIIIRTAYKTSTVTVSAAAKYTATQLGAIVPPSLLKNVIAAYNIVDKQNAAAETYAIKYALAAALTAGATLAWQIRRTALPPAPPGTDRSKWLATKHRVHIWLHKKLRSDNGLSRELEDAKRKLGEYETLRRVGANHASQTEELSGEAQSVQDGELQPTMDFNSMSDETKSLRQELEVEKANATNLYQALKETKEALKRTIAQLQEARTPTVEPKDQSRVFDDAEAATAWLHGQLKAAQEEAEKAKAGVASKEVQLQRAHDEASQATTNAASLQVRLDAVNRKILDVEVESRRKKKELLVVRQQQGQANAYLRYLSTQLQNSQQEAKQAKTQLVSREKELQVAQAAEQEAFHLKIQLNFTKEELELAQTEIETFKREAISTNTKLQVAEQEAKEAKDEVNSMKKKLDKANEDTKIAENGLEAVTKLLPDVQAQIDSLTTQLEASRKDEEKGRKDALSLERELGETRLEHSKQVASLEKQLQNPRQLVEEKDPLAEVGKAVNGELLHALNNENEDLKEGLRKEAARCKELEMEVKKQQREILDLKSDTEFYEGRLETYRTDLEALETEVEKLQVELDTAKAKDAATPPQKSFTSSGTQTLSNTHSFRDSPSLKPVRVPNSSPQLLSVVGGIISSTPPPNELPAEPTTPATTSTSRPNKTPDSVAIAYLYRDGKINLSEYVEGLAALPPRSNKRKPDDTEKTPRPVKKLRIGEESSDHPIVNVLTPGGGPAFRLPKQASAEKADDRIVLDRSGVTNALDTKKSRSSVAGLDNATPLVLPKQNTVKVDRGPLGDKPSILVRPATKRKLNAEDGEGSTKLAQMPRTEEDLGEEQIPTLDEFIPKPVTDTARCTANTSSLGGGLSVKAPAQGPALSKGSATAVDVGTTNEAAQLDGANSFVQSEQVVLHVGKDSSGDIVNDRDHNQEVATTIENKDSPPEEQHTPVNPVDPNIKTAIADSENAEAASSTRMTKPAPAQASRRKSRLTKPVPAIPRKSARNANKPTVSLNENVLSKRSVPPMKDGKALAASPAKSTAKQTVRARAGRSPSKGKKTK